MTDKRIFLAAVFNPFFKKKKNLAKFVKNLLGQCWAEGKIHSIQAVLSSIAPPDLVQGQVLYFFHRKVGFEFPVLWIIGLREDINYERERSGT